VRDIWGAESKTIHLIWRYRSIQLEMIWSILANWLPAVILQLNCMFTDKYIYTIVIMSTADEAVCSTSYWKQQCSQLLWQISIANLQCTDILDICMSLHQACITGLSTFASSVIPAPAKPVAPWNITQFHFQAYRQQITIYTIWKTPLSFLLWLTPAKVNLS